MTLSRRQAIKVCSAGVLLTALPTRALATDKVAIPFVYHHVANHFGIPAKILYAIALTESGFGYESGLRPWPWTLNIKGESRYLSSYTDAIQVFKTHLRETSLIDVGVMQISWRWHSERLGNPIKALSPINNVLIGASILKQQYQQCHEWWQAVGRYHSPGNSKQAKQRALNYRDRVYSHWKHL